MTYKLIITVPAYNDIDNIFAFIANNNIKSAKKLIINFEKQFDILLKFPNSGFKPDISQKDIRICVVAKNYQVVYKIDKSKVIILRILTRYQDICI